MRTSDDYYNRWEVASFARILRYVASFFAMTLPGLYLAVTNFHTQILPTSLMLSFAEARAGVPFPAVEANLVSSMVVILISFTALCSFAIPNEEFASAFRLLKFFFIAVCAWLGFFGLLAGLLFVLLHLSHLKSFGIPYMMPFVGADVTDYEDERDFLWRLPMRELKKRPIYARRDKRTRLRFFGERKKK